MYNKRGQITLFILIAIVILSITAVIFYIIGAGKTENQELTAETSQEFRERSEIIENFVKTCIDKSAEDTIWLFGAQGGRISEPDKNQLREMDDSLPKPILLARYYVEVLQFDGFNLVPYTEFLLFEMDSYMNEAIDDCLDNFSSFGNMVEKGETETDTIITNDYVNFNVNIPITIKDEGITKNLNKFNTKVNIALPKILDEARELIAYSLLNNGMFDASRISASEFNITVSDYDDSTHLYLIMDTNSKLRGEPYNFLFGARYKK